MSSPKKKLILFDGYCNLCSRSVRFILRRDSRKIFTFLPLQHAQTIEIPDVRNFSTDKPTSLILLDNGKIYLKSSAALRIAKHLRFPWNLFYALIIFPPFLRDGIYMFISDNRYRWFGKRNECFLPS